MSAFKTAMDVHLL